MNEERESVIQQRINEIGRESFPDSADAGWRILGSEHVGSYSFVEAEATFATVEYPQVVFVLLFGENDQTTVVGCYEGQSVHDGFYGGDGVEYGLLFAKPDTSDEWRSLFFEETSFLERLGTLSEHERERIVGDKIDDICQNGMVVGDIADSWRVLRFIHDEKYTFVECSPDSLDTESQRFAIVLAFTKSGHPIDNAAFQFLDESNRWEICYTACPTSVIREWEPSFPELDLQWPASGGLPLLIENVQQVVRSPLLIVVLLVLGAFLLWWFLR